MKIRSIVLPVFFCLIFIATTVCAEDEDVGLVQKVWRRFFGKPEAAKKVEAVSPPAPPEGKKTGNVLSESDGSATVKTQVSAEDMTPDELEAFEDLPKELESQKEERELLETIRAAQEAQKANSPIPRPPR